MSASGSTAPAQPHAHNHLPGESDLAVDVILVAFGPHAFLRCALEALASQTLVPRATIVVDNDPANPLSDGPWPLPIVIIRPGENLGFARAVNLALASTTAPWIALLNPDARPEPTWLESAACALAANPGAAWAASLVLSADDPTRLESAGHTLGLLGRGVRLSAGLRESEFLARHGAEPFTVPGAPACSALYSRAYFEATGGFEGDYFLVYEDLDADLRAAMSGLRCILVPTARVVHATSAIRGRGSDRSIFFEERNSIWLLARTLPLPWLLVVVPCKVLLLVYGFLIKAARGQIRPYVAGVLAGLAGLPRALAARRRILDRRR